MRSVCISVARFRCVIIFSVFIVAIVKLVFSGTFSVGFVSVGGGCWSGFFAVF